MRNRVSDDMINVMLRQMGSGVDKDHSCSHQCS